MGSAKDSKDRGDRQAAEQRQVMIAFLDHEAAVRKLLRVINGQKIEPYVDHCRETQ
jgi:hypothetical protein